MIAKLLAKLKGGKLVPEGRWKRTTICPKCAVETVQLKHGYTLDGQLWKGHECVCKSWQCSQCSILLERQEECCR